MVESKEVSSRFDMWIQYKDGYEEFLEIKYTSDLLKENVQNQLQIQKSWCEKNLKIIAYLKKNMLAFVFVSS